MEQGRRVSWHSLCITITVLCNSQLVQKALPLQTHSVLPQRPCRRSELIKKRDNHNIHQGPYRKHTAMPRCKLQARSLAFQASTPQGIMAAIHISNMVPIPHDVVKKVFKEPFSWMRDSMLQCNRVFGDPDLPHVPNGDEFKSCIKDVVFMHDKCDGYRSEWILLGTLTTGGWFYYTASCCYSGFYCGQGGMKCVVASSLGRLVEHGLDDLTRDRLAAKARRPECRWWYDLHATRIQAAFRGWRTRMRTWNPNTELGAGLLRAHYNYMVACDAKMTWHHQNNSINSTRPLKRHKMRNVHG